MSFHSARPLIAQALMVCLLFSCATTNLPPISAAGQAFEPTRDEARLWQESREEENKLLEKVSIYDDPLLEDYLLAIVGRLNPASMAANPLISYRVRVIEEPTLNAFAYPHGSLYIHTGLLAQMENEDQLATVLGHEMTHVENRHMLRYQRSARNKQIGLFALAVAGALWAASESAHAASEGHYGRAARIDVLSDLLIGLGLQLAFIAAVNGYGRELEREADEGGFAKMLDGGYDTRQAEKVYEKLAEETARSSKLEAFFFGSHPRIEERIVSARQWGRAHPATEPGTTEAGLSTFEKRLRPVIRDDAALNLALGRLGRAEEELRRALAMEPRDPRTLTLIGELKLAQAEQTGGEEKADLEAAAQDALQQAIELDPRSPKPHRELGLLAYRRGDGAFACRELRAYLDLSPAGAEDRTKIRDYVLELERDGLCESP
ncbi:MAG: M48 family metalloprotease [Acidobacteriota bacterium]|nr:M48 family metalloprotease [Acidobacteriota bacterium]MDQ7086910.1 M48 family metalloprotease [Acidobacteriota bacterium]